MLIPFKKMNAQGNDFVILDHFANQALDVDFPRLAQDICDRHFGVGADGLVILEPCADGDARMIIFNNDGTRAEMCGSALRCVSFMMMQKTHKDQVDIVTDSGLKQAKREGDFITVNLGKPELIRQKMQVDEF
ncbi:MAG: diaminopimelate epimerase, partial [Candidatus Cloacimonetes bacterium]|nr:diaminopimelate epimerase [Candidatus Cloacimonadota bacterium]